MNSPQPIQQDTLRTTASEMEKLVVEPALFYRDRGLWIMGSFILAGIILCLLVLFNLFLGTELKSVPVVFQTDQEGALVREQPLDQSNQQENVLLNWVADLVMNINTFNFVNYDTVLQASNPFFMPAGYAEYKAALQTFKIINKVLDRKLVLLATPLDAPHVILEKVFAGRYMWKIQIPVQFKYQSVGFVDTDTYRITLVVMRVPVSESPRGVLVLKYDMEEIPPM